MAAIYLPCPGHRAAIREVVGFAIQGDLIATGRTPDPYRGRAVPEGQEQVLLTPAPGPRLCLRDPTGPPRALRAHGDRAGPGRR